MSATFTDDDIDKAVENATGEVIGTVTAVENDTARVEPRAGIVDSIRATLGWSRATDETITVHATAVDEITSEAIRLEVASVDALEEAPQTGPDSADPDETPARDDASETELESDDVSRRDAGIEPTEEPSGAARRDTAAGRDETADRSADERDERDRNAVDQSGEPIAPDRLEETEGRLEESDDDETPRSGEIEPSARAERLDDTEPSGEADATETDASDRESTAASDENPTAEAMSETDVREADRAREPTETVTESDVRDVAEPDADETSGSPQATSGPRTAAQSESIGAAESSEPADTMGASETTDATRSSEPIDGATVQNRATDHNPETGAVESAAETESETSTEETDSADEIGTGPDIESALESDEGDGGSETDERDVADEIGTGVDIESAAESADTGDRGPDSDPSETEAMDLTDELDRGVDIESATEAAPRRESEGSESEADTGTEADPDVEIDTGADLESAVEPDRRPDETAGDRSSPGSEEGRADRGRKRRRAGSPLTAMLAAQRTALAQGQDALRRSFAVQQRAARSTVETPLLVQRQAIETAQTATRSYFDAVGALMGTAGVSGAQRRSADEPTTGREPASAGTEGEDLPRQLETHLERLRAVRAELDNQAEAGSERAASVLERQIELLERCRERLDATDE